MARACADLTDHLADHAADYLADPDGAQILRVGDRHRLRAAVHESGHAVAAVVLGHRVRRVVARRPRPYVEYDVPRDGHDPAVIFAGPWCEARWLAGREPITRDLRRVLARNVSDDRQLALHGGIELAALDMAPLLERCWSPVVTLAQKLIRDGEARHIDVCEALGIPAKDNDHHLATIRNSALASNPE